MMPAVSADLSQRLVPDELWELVAPLLPSFAAKRNLPSKLIAIRLDEPNPLPPAPVPPVEKGEPAILDKPPFAFTANAETVLGPEKESSLVYTKRFCAFDPPTKSKYRQKIQIPRVFMFRTSSWARRFHISITYERGSLLLS